MSAAFEIYFFANYNQLNLHHKFNAFGSFPFLHRVVAKDSLLNNFIVVPLFHTSAGAL
jgi:hypothetical protein